ncbi:hypothetical protein CXB51_002243 [Gossypium anomalum]|uniref:WRC domain-containing protein n=1 Tax=Gossypium anomalum TaxID=47600 RepID=A0A8J5ZMB1_9ROSI|nr:hypothetical protein CXB51_002243 [Gossypium anomalum]
MRIRNSGNSPQRSLSPPPPSPPTPSFSTSPSHVMVSRTNARLSSIDSPVAQDGSVTDDCWSVSTKESLGHSIFGQTSTSSNSVSSSLSFNGRWCEEERAIPLKKRRVVMLSYETKQQSRERMEKDTLMEERNQNQRCNRRNGKGWRCNKMKVKGHSLCNHHLEMQKMRNSSTSSTTTNQGEDGDGAGRPAFAVRENKRVKVVKARSMSSLLRDTVPLFYY